MMIERNTGDVWVCEDCYFAHHYGVTVTAQGDHPNEIVVSYDEIAKWRDAGDTIRFYAGDTDTPSDREPLNKLDGLRLFDNTCSNHFYGQAPAFSDFDDGYAEACEQCGSFEIDNGIDTFSSRPCGGCGSTLGGSRHRLTWEAR